MVISKALGQNHPESCRAIHLNSNMCLPNWWNPVHLLQYLNARYLPSMPLLLNANEIKSQKFVQSFLETGNGMDSSTCTSLSCRSYV